MNIPNLLPSTNDLVLNVRKEMGNDPNLLSNNEDSLQNVRENIKDV